MKRILALFASPYQLLALNRIIDQYYPDDKVYLAVADTISKAEYLVEKAKAEERFSDGKSKEDLAFQSPSRLSTIFRASENPRFSQRVYRR